MKCIFRYCFNRVLSREMGFNKLAAFSSSNVNFLHLRHISGNSSEIEKPGLKCNKEPVMAEDLNPAEVTRQPIFTKLAGLVNNYEILQNFVDLGVDLRTFEKDLGLCSKILKFDFKTHVAPYLEFLIRQGVPGEELGIFITANPRIFFSDLDNLQVRVNYLYSKNFDKDMILKIITKNPKWLSHEVVFVDKFLGKLQELFELPGCKVREIVVKYPSILNVSLAEIHLKRHLFKNTFHIDVKTMQSAVIDTPQLLKMDSDSMTATYFYLKDIMSVSPDQIMAQSKVLLYRIHFIQIKHLFLKYLGKDQYDPKLPGYVSIMDLFLSNDKDFAEKIAKSSVKLYYDFQKTL